MSYNFLNYNGKLVVSSKCLYDSNVGYEANFSVNGEVDGWTYYDGIHTYGCWNNFLFGTLYGSYATIGRGEVFVAVAAESFYNLKIVMKLNMIERTEHQLIPTRGLVMWRTISDPTWSVTKQQYFELYNDSEWHTYSVNLAEAQWWQGDVNDLRIYPILENGRDGDEFYIRSIEITSIDSYRCLNHSCDYYTQYTHNCPGVGERGYCKSQALPYYIYGGVTFEFAEDKKYNVIEGVNDVLLVNINGYGYENVTIPSFSNYSGEEVAKVLAKEISKVDVGGYAECDVEYTNQGEFKIYSGVYADDSTIVVGDSQLAKDLNFVDATGVNIFTPHVGTYPASGFKPYSSFKIKTHQIYSLIDSNTQSSFYFNPFIYSIEGGRRDWISVGLGDPKKDVRSGSDDDSGMLNRSYSYIDNSNKTIIDFTHPINASGRINKIYAGVTLDSFDEGNWSERGTGDSNRQVNQLSGAKIMFFRPLKNGNLSVLPTELTIENRNYTSGKIYSAVQEYVEIDCDIFLNKGDLIGVYNANVYVSKSVTGEEVDALYYQVSGKASGTLSVRQPLGEGSAGLLLYARSDQIQNRLVLELDLGHRVNIENIKLIGTSEEATLEYNVARCLDIDWTVDLFGEDHTTGFIISYRPLVKAYYNHPNVYYGKDCLNDGIKVVSDGIAADSYSIQGGTYYNSIVGSSHKKDGGAGVVLSNPKYFSVNGDCEWLSVYLHAGEKAPFSVGDFEYDPIAFTLYFPFGKEKTIHKSKAYFKEKYNFRSFSLSTYVGPYYTEGNADDPHFNYIPERTDGTETPWKKITLDGLDYTPEEEDKWSTIDLYLAKNPCIGHSIEVSTGVVQVDMDGDMSYFDELGGLQYYGGGRIVNSDQYNQSLLIDWTNITHQWEPISAKGFRFYCNNHHSTKVCELELFCVVDNVSSSMGSSINVAYSPYGDSWWETENTEMSDGVSCFVGDTPQYLNIVVKPITEINLSGIEIDISYEDVFAGEKGCDYVLLPTETKIGSENTPEIIKFKNVYNRPYNLYVDIAADDLLDRGIIFFSLMNNEESITNPTIGADAYYKKQEDYPLLNYQKNVAINCPVYALRNLIKGASAWYSYNDEYSWEYWGVIEDGKDINFSNLPSGAITTINLPVLKRSKWWKIGFSDTRLSMTVREIKVYNGGQEISDIIFYNQSGNALTTSNSNTAPHLKNNIVNGSYYILNGNSYIGFELPDVQTIDKIVISHDFKEEYENSHDAAGIDSSTALCIHGNGSTYQTDTIVDMSYYEHDVAVVGNGIYCDDGTEYAYYDFTEDFSECVQVTEEFSEPTLDPAVWTDLVNATVVSGMLNITNSGTIGKALTAYYFSGNFDIYIDLDVDNAASNQGWGCYLSIFTDGGNILRVGRTYHYDYEHCFIAQYYGMSGWTTLGYREVDASEITNLKLRIVRVNSTSTCYVYDSALTWVNIGSSTGVSSDSVRAGLYSDLTPLAQGITTAKFDSFVGNRSDADWGVNTMYSSSFTCISGVGPNGYAYHYDMAVANHCNAAGYKIPKVFDFNSAPIDQDFVFTFDFTFQATSFTTQAGVSISSPGVSVGVISSHMWLNLTYYYYSEGFIGAQVMLKRDTIHIAIVNSHFETAYASTSLDTRATIYYCRFTNDGEGHYHCYVWTDGFGGSVLVANFGLNSSIKWAAGHIGVGSGGGVGGPYANEYSTCRAVGWVSDFNFASEKVSRNSILSGNSSIKFSGNSGEKLLVNYDSSPICNISKDVFYLDTKKFVFDFFIKFNSLPAVDGGVVYLFKCWADDQPLINGATITSPSSWAFTIERVSGSYKWRFYINVLGKVLRFFDFSFYPDMLRWHHIYFSRSLQGSIYHRGIIIDGYRDLAEGYVPLDKIEYSGRDVVVGENFDGWLGEIRISADYSSGGDRSIYYQDVTVLSKAVPTHQYERYYTFSIYDSFDNISYGRQMEVDALFNNTYSHYEPFSTWSNKYYSYFAIDLGQRHDIEIIRSYPVDTAYTFSLNSNILYSKKDTTDPVTAFSLTQEEAELSTNFAGQNYDYPNNWTKLDTIYANSYMIDDSFYQMCNPPSSQASAQARANFYFSGDFSFYIDYDIGTNYEQNNIWEVAIQLDDVDNTNNKVKFERCFRDNNHKYVFFVRDNSTSWTQVTSVLRTATRGTMKIVRAGYVFKVYVKAIEASIDDFELIAVYQIKGTFGQYLQMSLYTISASTSYPFIEVWWDNFVVTESNPIYSTPSDARWLRVKMLNGDSTTRTIKNVDVFSRITTQENAVGQYNNYWEELGTSITSYADVENIALGTVVSGTGFVGLMSYDNVVNGIIPDGDLSLCWGSTDIANPYFTVHFSEAEAIFKFKVYHGFSTTDANNIITDYKIQVSTDGETFTTVFDITDNSSYERTHELATPVYAKVVRFYVEDYKAVKRFVWVSKEDNYQFWEGAVLREFEIYKYYGFTVVNSEDTPIIAIDLQQPFFVDGHYLVGVNAENSAIDWDNSDSNFAWANSRLSDPQKIIFSDWGASPGYAKWAVVKRNTATHFPTVPSTQYPHTDTSDYLKHVVIQGSVDEIGSKPNPTEYPWMWRSTISELTYDYATVIYSTTNTRSLRINYPASTQAEHIRFIEGDHFGWDTAASWRDGFGMFFYIDDVNKLDLEYGYFYVGGYDYTPPKNPVIYRWNMTTFSGVLHNGWNNLNLTFLYADEVVYTELTDYSGRDPRRLYSINWGTMGFVFRGKGEAIQLNLEGFFIERNHFEHGCFPGERGLYLHSKDLMKLPVGELDFRAAALEFWIRPDWNWDGRDIYNDYKSRSLFNLGNTANDVFGAVVSHRGLEVYYGNLLEDFNMFVVAGLNFNPTDKVFHMAFVWSNDGLGISSDNSTIRVYINNNLVAKDSTVWAVSDNKYFNFILGGQGLLTQKAQGFDPTSSSVDAVINRFKLHNYCKTDFSDSLYDAEEGYDKELLKPSGFVEISKDNVTFHKVGSTELPFVFEDVAVDEEIPIWVKVRLPKNLKGSEKRTAGILGSWDIGV